MGNGNLKMGARGETGEEGEGEKGKREKGKGERGRKETYDLIGNIMPNVGLPLRLPLGILRDHELQIRVRCGLLARDPARLELDEVRLEEADLVLAVDARHVGVLAHDREVVEHLAAVDGGLGLRNQPVQRGEEKDPNVSVLLLLRRAS